MKSNNKILIIVVLSIVLVLSYSIYLILNNKKTLNSNNKNIIGQLDTNSNSYGYPSIKWVYCDDLEVNINAGIYRFGDIDRDGLIGYSDFETLKRIITIGGYGFSDETKHLADVDENGKIDNEDLKLFNDYLKKNKEVEYDIHKELILYCLSDINDVESCKWQEQPFFKVSEVKDYYAFVQHKNNKKISNYALVSRNIIK